MKLTMTNSTLPFTWEQCVAAYEEWGCNCGPTALAFAVKTSLESARDAIPDFDKRRYTSPTMMREALGVLQHKITAIRGPFHGQRLQGGIDAMFAGPMTLVRIQWTGPWASGGEIAKWAARQTHWIATWRVDWLPKPLDLVFDVNSGITTFEKWKEETVPEIVKTIKRADGGWYPANVWHISAKSN